MSNNIYYEEIASKIINEGFNYAIEDYYTLVNDEKINELRCKYLEVKKEIISIVKLNVSDETSKKLNKI